MISFIKTLKYYLYISSSFDVIRRSNSRQYLFTLSSIAFLFRYQIESNILLSLKSYIFLNKNILFVNSDFNIRCPFKSILLYERKARIIVICDIKLIFFFTSFFEKKWYKYDYLHLVSFYVIVDVKRYIKSKQLLCAIFNYPLITCKIFILVCRPVVLALLSWLL